MKKISVKELSGRLMISSQQITRAVEEEDIAKNHPEVRMSYDELEVKYQEVWGTWSQVREAYYCKTNPGRYKTNTKNSSEQDTS